MFATKTIVRTLVLAAIGLLVWSFLARPSGAHGVKQTYRVKPYDTLWSIASRHYGGDVRGAIWQIQQTNHLQGSQIVTGERLILP
jgi:nucleoid-associated protein YgaU